MMRATMNTSPLRHKLPSLRNGRKERKLSHRKWQLRSTVSIFHFVELLVTAAIVQGLGRNVADVVLSPSTVHRARDITRKQFTAASQSLFKDNDPLILHWDGKMLQDIAGEKKMVDRVAILVTGNEVEQLLLAVPKIGSGTGEAQAKACIRAIEDCGIKENIMGFVFDTTVANTGLTLGACAFLERTLGREVAWIACRHHVFEIVLAHVFIAVMGSSDGPNVSVFKRFQAHWPCIDQSNVSRIDDNVFNGVEEMKGAAFNFYEAARSEPICRVGLCKILE